MKNFVNSVLVAVGFVLLVMGCGGASSNGSSTTSSPANSANVGVTDEKPIAIDAKALTKEYESNELAADGKYKGKQLAVTGKISNIAETFGSVTVSLEGYKSFGNSVMCSFEDSERSAVMALKKGQQVTVTGSNEGSTAGMYVGLKKCKIK